MKTRLVTRFKAQYPGQVGVWYGTCPTWARGFPADAIVTSERVMVVNPRRVSCATCHGEHIDVAAPTLD